MRPNKFSACNTFLFLLGAKSRAARDIDKLLLPVFTTNEELTRAKSRLFVTDLHDELKSARLEM